MPSPFAPLIAQAQQASNIAASTIAAQQALITDLKQQLAAKDSAVVAANAAIAAVNDSLATAQASNAKMQQQVDTLTAAQPDPADLGALQELVAGLKSLPSLAT